MLRLLLAILAATATACAASGAAAGARATTAPPGGADEAAAREVLGRFARALERGRFQDAHALLSARWHQAYTPGRLALDFRGAGPSARESAARILARLESGAPFAHSPGLARLPLGEGRTALLVQEPGGWRVDALEEPSAARSRR